MPLTPGTRLGPYEIVAPLGAGGMGEVWRARDTRLGRDVAVKVLPEHLSAQPDVRTRFEREAKTISSLNHPHICTLHDIGREGDTDFLVMELVDGETLAQRLARGPLPPADVLRFGGQIADALDRAHRAGVIHRDLKPGNVMLTKSGAKLMDFGLARASDLAGPTSSSGVTMAALSRTQPGASPLTAEGTLVGTFQYMAPEQLEGGDADARSDLWALGCVLYEMATGTRAFEGKSQASLIVSIMSYEPPAVSQVAPLAPQALDNLVRALLAKDPDERVQTAHDVRLQLQWMTGGSQSGPAISGVTAAPVHAAAAAKRRDVPRRVWIAGAGAVLVAFAAGAVLMPALTGARHAAAPPLRLTATLPSGLRLSGAGGNLELAPDGSALVFVATDSAGVNKIYVRPLDGRPAIALDGTEGGFMPFWSPDAKSVAFFASDKLRRTSITGGMPQDICAAASPRGGSWGADDVILFAPGADSPIFRVSAKGGTPAAVTALDAAQHETGHRFPRFLPDGRHFFFATTPAADAQHKIYFAAVGSTARRFVLGSDCSPTYAPEGYLFSHRNSMVYAQRFDARSGKLSGEPHEFLAASQGSGFQASPCIFASTSGMLAFVPDAPRDERLCWVDRSGHVTPVAGLPVGGWAAPRFSADGKRIVAQRASAEETASTGVAIWVADVTRGVASRLSFTGSIDISPVWSPDGQNVIYSSVAAGVYQAYEKSAAGAGDPVMISRGPGFVWGPLSWSPDGRTVLFSTDNAQTASDVWTVAMDARHTQAPLLHAPYSEDDASFSPDGRWIAYTSNESGRREVYAQAFPALGSKVQISTEGGEGAQWSPSGRELFFRAPDQAMMSVAVTLSPTLTIGTPQRLFKLDAPDNGFAIAPDGQRFVMSLSGGATAQVAPQIVLNWTKLLKPQ